MTVPAVSDGTMPCPVPSPTGPPCSKKIPAGWTADEGHSGGHYDASAALAGLPFEGHSPEDCRPGCPKWRTR